MRARAWASAPRVRSSCSDNSCLSSSAMIWPCFTNWPKSTLIFAIRPGTSATTVTVSSGSSEPVTEIDRSTLRASAATVYSPTGSDGNE